LVLVGTAFWLVEPVADGVAEDDGAVDVVLLLGLLAVEVLVPPAPPEPDRLPRRRGAMSAANRSAVTTPLNRMVRWMSPVVMVAVRSAAVSGFAVPDSLRAIHAAAATTMAITTAIHHPRRRGLCGVGRSSAGPTGGGAGTAVPGSVLGTEALLMRDSITLKRA
jgi:hypothetical protein